MKGTCGPLRSERLDIEPAQPHHAVETFEHLKNDAMWTHFPQLRPESEEVLRATYARRARGAPDEDQRWENWILRDRATGAAVGDLQATIFCSERTAIVAYGVFLPFRKRGYAREAAAVLLAHLHAQHGVLRAQAEISAQNEESQRVVGALGFQCVRSAGEEWTFERELG